MLETDFKIATLIVKHLIDHIDPHEQKELDKWKNESQHNRLLFDRLVLPSGLQQLQQMAACYDAQLGWSRYLQKQRTQKRRVFFIRAGYAAIFLILLSVGYLFVSYQKRVSDASLRQFAGSALIIPGGTKATLTLADGSSVALDEYNDYKIEEKKEAFKDAPESAPVYHKIETPRGGEYAFTLSDGTRVQLNALSVFHFPTDFGDYPRRVELEGEAFFEVTSNGKPFIIKTKEMLIEVMGTSFNVSSYNDEMSCSVTLVNGSLRIQTGSNEDRFELTPTHQALFDRNTGETSVRQVDVSSYIAWSNGMFYFKDWTLESIMHYLSRWYDIDEVIYKDERLKTMMFGCKFSKYNNIEQFLRAFEHTGKIAYHIQEKTIIFNNTK